MNASGGEGQEGARWRGWERRPIPASSRGRRAPPTTLPPQPRRAPPPPRRAPSLALRFFAARASAGGSASSPPPHTHPPPGGVSRQREALSIVLRPRRAGAVGGVCPHRGHPWLTFESAPSVGRLAAGCLAGPAGARWGLGEAQCSRSPALRAPRILCYYGYLAPPPPPPPRARRDTAGAAAPPAPR